MPLTDLDFCNLAIDKVSGDRIADFTEDSPLAVFCAGNWPQKRAMLLGKYRWTFATAVRLLSAVTPGPTEALVMAYKFTPPADLVGAIHAFRDRADPYAAERTPYVLLVDNHYWADDARVYAEYTAERAEALWPSWFVELALYAFAADLAAHCQNRSLQRDYEAKAWGTPSEGGEGGLYAQARNEDARQAPQRQLVACGVDAGPLVESRFSGASSSRMFDHLRGV